jgi:hypothetical protein
MQLADAEQAAKALGIRVKPYRAASLGELQNALAAIVDDGMDGLLKFQGGLSLSNRQLIVDFAAEHRLPAIYQATLFAEAGGLMSWAPDLENQYKMAADYVDKILKGAKPGDLPITYPPKYFLTINSTAAPGARPAYPSGATRPGRSSRGLRAEPPQRAPVLGDRSGLLFVPVEAVGEHLHLAPSALRLDEDRELSVSPFPLQY